MANNSFTEEQIMQQIQNANEKITKAGGDPNPKMKVADATFKRRNLMVIGCGDGGSMVAQEIRASVPETYAICYNTSGAATDGLRVDITIVPEAEDGSGKVRDYSKEVFKQGSYKHLLGNVQAALEKRPDIDYIFVITTADGGTGSGVSPMVAKFISDNTEVPVIIIGIYPNLMEDAIAQYNTMNWQSEVEKIGLPYMIFDNNINGKLKPVIHRLINKEIATMLKVITGDYYGNTDISMIDSRDMYMLLQHTGKRIFIETDTTRPRTGETLDEYIDAMINDAYQPKPDNVKGLGIFVKGPKQMLDTLDTSVSTIRNTYGNAAVQYTHVEESDNIQISVIMTGCSEPVDRLYTIRSRYDDIMAAQKADSSVLNDITSGLDNPFGTVKTKHLDKAEPDLSALDI